MADITRDSEEYAKLKYWCKENEEATEFLYLLGKISQIADDFVDGDIDDSQKSEQMSELLMDLIVKIPANKFYLQYQSWLLPILSMSILSWDASNKWSKSLEINDLVFAYVYRDIYEIIIQQVALIIGDTDWARTVTQDVQNYYHSNNKETLASWIQEQQQLDGGTP